MNVAEQHKANQESLANAIKTSEKVLSSIKGRFGDTEVFKNLLKAYDSKFRFNKKN